MYRSRYMNDSWVGCRLASLSIADDDKVAIEILHSTSPLGRFACDHVAYVPEVGADGLAIGLAIGHADEYQSSGAALPTCASLTPVRRSYALLLNEPTIVFTEDSELARLDLHKFGLAF
jgi:hypothetical protein